MVPLLELMTNKAMKPRHWARMAEVTGHVFDVESETFQLRNILEAPLLQFKEDIEVQIYILGLFFLLKFTRKLDLIFINFFL
jgi:dynein heavy chain